MIRASVIPLALLAAGCAFHRGDPLPADPPRDFTLEVTVTGVEGWQWEGRLRFEEEGFADYDVTYKGPPPANRRGREPVDGAAVRAAWAAAAAAGVFDRTPVPMGQFAGPLLVEGRALRLDGRICGDPASEPRLAALLEALRAAVPARVMRTLPAEEPER
jgi:hypothetical protein